MNIFILSLNKKENAIFHNDKHVVKMILEHTQLLCSAHHMTGGTAPYKLTHKNHPCAIWTRESLSNYFWLLEMTMELGKEYTYRYGKVHKSIQICIDLPYIKLPDIGLTPFKLCMDDEYKIGNDVVASYRNYYIKAKNHIATWKSREVPEWYKIT